MLTLGLAGCIHGFDGRKTSTQSVADQNSSAPMVVGPFRKPTSRFTPPAAKPAGKQTAADAKPSKPTVSKRESLPRLEEINKPQAKTASTKEPTVRRDSHVIPTEYQQNHQAMPAEQEPVYFPDDEPIQPPVTTPQKLSAKKKAEPAANAVTSEPAPFAEFERAIPITSKPDKPKILPVSGKEPVQAPPAESSSEAESSPLSSTGKGSDGSAPQAEPLPTIIPLPKASTLTPQRELPPPATGLSKEQTPVAEPSKATARPRDVALLVEQVFEDLRQRRLDDARERTEWLKRLVTSGTTPTQVSTDAGNSNDAPATSTSAPETSPISREPKRLDAESGKALTNDGPTPSKALAPSAQSDDSDDEVPLSK